MTTIERPITTTIAACLTEAAIDIRATSWKDATGGIGSVHIEGHVVAPDREAGVLRVDGSPVYCAAWL